MAGGREGRQFVEVKWTPGGIEAGGPRRVFEVVLASGVMLRVPEGFDAVSLDELFDVLEKHRC